MEKRAHAANSITEQQVGSVHSQKLPKKAPPDFNPSGAHTFKTSFPSSEAHFVAV
jgi:hypothetical protein